MTKLFFRFNNKSSLLEAVSILDYPDGGGTNIQLALNVARTDIFTRSRGDRFDADNIVILITDGRSTVDSEMTIPAADRLRLESSVKVSYIKNTQHIYYVFVVMRDSPAQNQSNRAFFK